MHPTTRVVGSVIHLKTRSKSLFRSFVIRRDLFGIEAVSRKQEPGIWKDLTRYAWRQVQLSEEGTAVNSFTRPFHSILTGNRLLRIAA
jgi:hypothetical protein